LVPKQTAKKPFRNRAAADITCTNKEDAFHNLEGASERDSKPKVELVQVNFALEYRQGAPRNVRERPGDPSLPLEN
jgi:hypothetical protein